MEVEKIIDVPTAHLYRVLVDSAVYDIQQHSKESVDPDNLIGISYQKTMQKGGTATITITEQEVGHAYGFETKAPNQTFHTRYEVEEIGDKSKIRYAETITSEKSLQTLNDKIVGRMLKRSKKKRILRLFEAIEKDYQQQINR